jgi:acetylornithine deacetylase/succinyl-diaminopimelate desuccinylase family protein
MGVMDILASLVRIDSVNPEWGGPGEAGVAKWVRGFLETHGIEAREREILPGRRNVYGVVPGKDRLRRIVFEAHMDSVSAKGMDIEPFEPGIRDGKLYGRGSVDVKAGLAAMLHALAEVREPPCDVWLAAVVDEEHQYRGVLGLLEDLPGAEAAIVAEPTGNRIVRANKGVLRWSIRTTGKAAHSSTPHLGKNAIMEMARVMSRIGEYAERLGERGHPLVGSPTCCVSLVEGGTQVNIVPEHCRITIDRRMLPGETGDGVFAEFREFLAGLDYEMEPPTLCDEALETSENARVVRVAQGILGEMGGDPEAVGVPFGCDVTKLSRAGIPGIIFGPGSIEQAHAAVEFVEIAQVEFAAEFYRRMMMGF